MRLTDFTLWYDRLVAPNGTLVLWALLAVALFALAFWGQRRAAAAKARAERARREAELEDLGGNSYFMPLPTIEQAVVIANPVEIDSLLNGEPETVVARARAQLDAPTDISMGGDPDELPYVLGSAPRPAPAAAAPVQRPIPVLTDAIPPTIAVPLARSSAPAAAAPILPPMPAPAPVAAARPAPAPAAPAPTAPVAARPTPAPAAPFAPRPAAPAPATPVAAAVRKPAPVPIALPAMPAVQEDEQTPIAVRDLVLTWFEARGYRANAISVQFRPIELELRHRTDVDRNYAFVVERERVTALRAAALLKLAKSAGHARLLIAAERGSEPQSLAELRRLGVRVFDERAIRAELDKIDLRVAAKIIAVARGRNPLRRSAAVPVRTPVPAVA
jgi:hypothetical protein